MQAAESILHRASQLSGGGLRDILYRLADLAPMRRPMSLSPVIVEREDKRVNLVDVSEFLRVFRERSGADGNEERLLARLRDHGAPEWIDAGSFEQLERIEKGEDSGSRTLREMTPIFRAYGIPTMMVDYLLSDSTTSPVVVQSLEHMREIRPGPETVGYGTGATYMVPEKTIR